MKKRKLFFIVFIFIICGKSFGQFKKPSMIIPSPNASSLGVFGEVPVSYFSGIPSISIPIYETKGTRINLPISLDYYASGARADAHPGWVGNSWSLSAGGAITRIIHADADERYVPSHKTGYYYRGGDLNRSDWASTALISNADFAFNHADIDLEPDEFMFNFMGFSGKFFLDEKGNWQVQCDKAIKVIFDNSDMIDPFLGNTGYTHGAYFSKTFKKFTLIDEVGNKYIFGNENAIEYSDEMTPDFSPVRYFYATSWFLSNIESADGSEIINLNYERGPFTSYMYQAFNASYIRDADGGFLDPGCTYQRIERIYNGNVISPVYLTSIEIPKQSLIIDFLKSKSHELTYSNLDYNRVSNGGSDFLDILNYSNLTPYFSNPQNYPGSFYGFFLWFKLDSFEIKNSVTNTLLKKVSFNYTDEPTKRLQLNSLYIKDEFEQDVQKYAFHYNLTPLPNYLTTIGDHWGFNNNVKIPFDNNADYNTIKAPDEVQTKAGILERIDYPTGGVTFFEYEINRYGSIVRATNRTQVDSESGIAGGLRIKKITNVEQNGTVQTREFYYVKNYVAGSNPNNLISSGVLDAKPKYYFEPISAIDEANLPFTFNYLSSNPIVPLTANSGGKHIGYTEVIEKRSDNSFTKYTYTNHDNGYHDILPNNTYNSIGLPSVPFSSTDFERGKILSKSDYNSIGKLIFENNTEYSRINPSDKCSKALSFHEMLICKGAGRNFLSSTAYLYYFYPFVATKHTIKNYSLTGSLLATTVTDLTYDEYQNVIEQKTVDSKGSVYKKNLSYPASMISSGRDPNGIYQGMVAKNMVSPVVEDVEASDNIKTSLITTNYYNPFVNLFVPQTIQVENIKSGLPETRYVYQGYDNDGNVQSILNEGLVKSCYIWAYNGQYLIAKIDNADYNTLVSILGGENNVKTFKEKPNPSNAEVTQFLSVLRTSTLLKDAQITTYTYEPLVGLRSVTDIRNQTTYYEYDSFQRLKLIKDQHNNIVKSFDYHYKQ